MLVEGSRLADVKTPNKSDASKIRVTLPLMEAAL